VVKGVKAKNFFLIVSRATKIISVFYDKISLDKYLSIQVHQFFFTLVEISLRDWGHLVYHRTTKIPRHPVLASLRMDDKITGIRKPVDYIRRLKGLWPIRVREGNEGVYTLVSLRNSVALRRKATGFPETTEKSHFSARCNSPDDYN
jgi:hypothetical protein